MQPSRTCRKAPIGFTTIELKTNFLGTLTKGVLLCAASAVHSGRTTQVWDAEVEQRGMGGGWRLFSVIRWADDVVAERCVRSHARQI